MPTYEYACDKCGHEFEEYQAITAKPLRKCPKCGQNRLQRLIGTGGGVIFKGSGFYQTDYRSDSYKKAAAAEKPSSGDSSKSESSKSNGEAAKKDGTAAKSSTCKPDKRKAG